MVGVLLDVVQVLDHMAEDTRLTSVMEAVGVIVIIIMTKSIDDKDLQNEINKKRPGSKGLSDCEVGSRRLDLGFHTSRVRYSSHKWGWATVNPEDIVFWIPWKRWSKVVMLKGGREESCHLEMKIIRLTFGWQRKDGQKFCSNVTCTLGNARWRVGRRTCQDRGWTCSHPQLSDPGKGPCFCLLSSIIQENCFSENYLFWVDSHDIGAWYPSLLSLDEWWWW